VVENRRRRITMKKALVTAIIAMMFSALFLMVGYAQGEEAAAGPETDLLQEELIRLGDTFAGVKDAFAGLQEFMHEIVSEVKGNMVDIEDLDGRVASLKDAMQAMSLELKSVEGKILNLQEDSSRLSSTQQELMVRSTALESGLSELSASFEEFQAQITASLDATNGDLYALSQSCDALAAKLDDLNSRFVAFNDGIMADVSALKKGQVALEDRVKQLEDQDVGTFKKKVIELERAMSALSIKIDNNRAKLEGFDQAIADLSVAISTNQAGILANTNVIEDHDARIAALEGGAALEELKAQVDGLYFIAIVALLAGVGALIWGFMG
jgi:chromosome segregation ATPase